MPSSHGVVLFNADAANTLAFLLGYYTQPYTVCHLIGYDMTMLHTTTLAALQAVEMPLGDGYAPLQMPLNLGNPSWALSQIANGALGVYKNLSWTFDNGRQVWGYWINDSTDVRIIWGEMWAVSYVFSASGGTFLFTPSVTLTSQP
jgi:hypothetical protein